MTDRIKVWVIDYGESRKNYILQWIDPTTGKRKSKTSGTAKRREAERAAIELENRLNSITPNADGKTEWQAFVDVFERLHLSSLKESSALRAISVLNVFTELMDPRNLRAITTAALSQYAAKLRAKQRSEATISSHMTNMRVALRWARDQGYIDDVPKLPRLARNTSGRTMKGRPLTDAEFVQMLRAVRGVVGKPAARSWRRFLRGLWLSGLRLDEGLHLTWDDPGQLWLDFTGRFPVLMIPLERDKGHRERAMPITPDFARWLLRTPPERRKGYVFTPLGDRGEPVRSKYHVGRVISEIGAASGIVVDHRKGKTASAHDLRRSFGLRWSSKVMPQILKELMRHESIETTMRYYVGVNAMATAETLWKTEHNT